MDFEFNEKKLKFFQRVLNNRVLFKIVLLFLVPMNFVIGMRLRELNGESCKVSVPYRWFNKNLFRVGGPFLILDISNKMTSSIKSWPFQMHTNQGIAHRSKLKTQTEIDAPD